MGKILKIGAILSLLVSTCSFADLLVEHATVRLLPPGVPNTSAYFTIENTGETDRYLVSASSTFSASTELHAHIMDGEMMRMEQQQQVMIPAGEKVMFKPGGLHLMIFGLKAPLKEQQKVSFTLYTKDKHQIEVIGNVVLPGEEHSHHHH
ncbi:copper chaperone PCu(A)C [Aliiglaciecola sp. LCG003]|uniref:copper chaperone PCu(A)C n=1 Tax=Aliiglaciecola sp. LCG003 TaxID=3053655 RepID=UPI0025723368|nr:copper chaperone PCu(A)C [Aliiglaciecola sp. LCG003]WJG09922.1 copper chaperone PCu(A)C [Aliiglaciecola sp. LCG003]